MTAPFLAPDRDESYRPGRAKAATNYYTIPGWAPSNSSFGASTAGRDSYEPFWVASPIVIDQIAFETTSAVAGNARVGIYRADRDLQPMGAPLADSGDISTAASGVKTFTPGTPLYLPRGRYLGVWNFSATPQYRYYYGPATGFGSSLGTSPLLQDIYVARAYAAFPTPGTTWNAVSLEASLAGRRMIVYRVSAP